MVVREQGLMAANVFGRSGAALAPLFAFLQAQLRSCFVPLLVLGCLCVSAGALVVLLPETLGEKTPETIQVCVLIDLHLTFRLGHASGSALTDSFPPYLCLPTCLTHPACLPPTLRR